MDTKDKKPVKKPVKKHVKKPLEKPVRSQVKNPVKKPVKKPVKNPVDKSVRKNLVKTGGLHNKHGADTWYTENIERTDDINILRFLYDTTRREIYSGHMAVTPYDIELLKKIQAKIQVLQSNQTKQNFRPLKNTGHLQAYHPQSQQAYTQPQQAYFQQQQPILHNGRKVLQQPSQAWQAYPRPQQAWQAYPPQPILYNGQQVLQQPQYRTPHQAPYQAPYQQVKQTRDQTDGKKAVKIKETPRYRANQNTNSYNLANFQNLEAAPYHAIDPKTGKLINTQKFDNIFPSLHRNKDEFDPYIEDQLKIAARNANKQTNYSP